MRKLTSYSHTGPPITSLRGILPDRPWPFRPAIYIGITCVTVKNACWTRSSHRAGPSRAEPSRHGPCPGFTGPAPYRPERSESDRRHAPTIKAAQMPVHCLHPPHRPGCIVRWTWRLIAGRLCGSLRPWVPTVVSELRRGPRGLTSHSTGLQASLSPGTAAEVALVKPEDRWRASVWDARRPVPAWSCSDTVTAETGGTREVSRGFVIGWCQLALQVIGYVTIEVWMLFNPRPTGGGGYFEPPPSRFLAISSKPMQVSPPNLQYPLSQHFYTLC